MSHGSFDRHPPPAFDVFAVRVTDQAGLQQALGLDGHWTESSRRQLELAVRAVERLRPVAIVVVNALASRLMQEPTGPVRTDSLREDKGHHVWLVSGHAMPVFLSGTLTGRRALDGYNRQRLGWHIRWVIGVDLRKGAVDWGGGRRPEV